MIFFVLICCYDLDFNAIFLIYVPQSQKNTTRTCYKDQPYSSNNREMKDYDQKKSRFDLNFTNLQIKFTGFYL